MDRSLPQVPVGRSRYSSIKLRHACDTSNDWDKKVTSASWPDSDTVQLVGDDDGSMRQSISVCPLCPVVTVGPPFVLADPQPPTSMATTTTPSTLVLIGSPDLLPTRSPLTLLAPFDLAADMFNVNADR